MTETFFIDKSLSEKEIYKLIILQIENLIKADEPVISILSNFTAVLKEAFNKISWIGFYLLKGNKLYLGPFQGKIACSVIEIGKGVCGTAVSKKETIIVENVHEFSNHIVCDANSKSEIVIPLKKGKEIFGVLDLDSYQYSAFNNVDKEYLEYLCSLIAEKIDNQKIHNLVVQ